jgi:glutamyl-tRNA synthetase
MRGRPAGDNQEVFTREELINAFSLERISRSGGAFDQDKLLWMNGLYIRQMSPEALYAAAEPFIVESGLVTADSSPEIRAYAAAALALEQEKLTRLDEAPNLIWFFFTDSVLTDEKVVAKWLQKSGVKPYLAALADTVDALSEWSSAAIEDAVRGVAAEQGREKGAATHPVRIAVTGREQGPSLFDCIEVLGKERAVKRLRAAMERAHE